jgi:hypothetical protein
MHSTSLLTRFVRRTRRAAGLLAIAAAGSLLPLSVGTATLSMPSPAMAQAKDAGDDVIVFKTGKTVKGKITDETATQVRIKVSIGGIAAETTYDKSDITSITHGTSAAPATQPQPGTVASKDPLPSNPAGSDVPRVYKIELTGLFGQDISQTPIRQAVKDAKKNNADYIIVVVDNDWSLRRQGQMGEHGDEESQFEGFWRAEDIDPVLTEEIEREWTKKPKVVFWIKKAMGGAAFLPLSCPTIYFHSEGKMGGIGHVEDTVKSGDKVVKEKLIGARLGHVRGMANKGGYDARIVLAMARTEYVLSYRMVGGKPELLERMPEGPDEFLLTDDGQGSNQDTEEQLARGEGNDNLTLKADVAYKLGVSKGTVDSYDDLMFQLGLARNNVQIKGQSEQIMKGWRDGLFNAKRELKKLWQSVTEVAVKSPGGFHERTAARSKRKNLMEEMQTIEKRYEEALNPRSVPVPDWADLETRKKEIELDQLKDKEDKK